MLQEMIMKPLVSAVQTMWKQAMRAVAGRNGMPMPLLSNRNDVAIKARDHKLG